MMMKTVEYHVDYAPYVISVVPGVNLSKTYLDHIQVREPALFALIQYEIRMSKGLKINAYNNLQKGKVKLALCGHEKNPCESVRVLLENVQLALLGRLINLKLCAVEVWF